MNNSDCEVCNPPDKYKELDIKEYRYWRVGLNSNQYYLGRCVILLKRHVEDFFDINEDELLEFYEITKHLRDVISKLFHPSLFNYATLGNEVRHVHLHLIPRYEKSLMFNNITFLDERWGKNFSPYNKEFMVPDETLLLIRDEINSHIG